MCRRASRFTTAAPFSGIGVCRPAVRQLGAWPSRQTARLCYAAQTGTGQVGGEVYEGDLVGYWYAGTVSCFKCAADGA